MVLTTPLSKDPWDGGYELLTTGEYVAVETLI